MAFDCAANYRANLRNRTLGQRATAARALPGRAAIAVIGYRDGCTIQIAVEQIGQMQAWPISHDDRDAEHLVEITVVQVATPVYRDQASAHHMVQVRVVVR